jgi:hypothetical protein
VSGLQELSKNFQVIIFSLLNERLCSLIIDFFDKEGIIFDAFYQKLRTQSKNSEDYANYDQVFRDFEVKEPINSPALDNQKVLSSLQPSI